MNNREPVSIPDVYEDPRIPLEIYRTTFVRSLAMVPIRTQNPIGAIGIYWATTHSPTPDQLRILQIIADSTAVAIQNILAHQEFEERIRLLTEKLEAASEELHSEAQLRKQLEAKILQLSLIDELTGLNNRRGILLRAEQMLKLVNRFETHGWLIYIDLDGLKRVNDELGRDAGDQLVRNGARILRESFRDSDVIGRIGGAEFIVFTTGSSTPAVEIEERITRNIEHHNRCYPDQIPISMSIGVIRCDPHSIHTLEDMIHQADAAMYIEKRRKRERLRNGIHH
jgi:diguanylate cyclase (GGDEF)-like protein